LTGAEPSEVNTINDEFAVIVPNDDKKMAKTRINNLKISFDTWKIEDF